MIDAMPRPRPPYLVRQVTESGKTVWFFRIGHGPRTRLREPFGSPAFMKEYQAALRAEPLKGPAKPHKGTLRWLWDRYRETQAWARLSVATRRQRENIMHGVLDTAGNDPFEDIDRKTMVKGRDRRSKTPAMARHFVDTMRGMFDWAVDAEIAAVNPTIGVKVSKPATEGHAVWSDEEISRFRAAYPIGTRERLAFDLLFYTGLRRGDVVFIGRQHCKNGVLTLRTGKTGEVVSIRILPDLADSLAAGPTGDLAFIASDKTGQPMKKESFGNWFREICTAAGCPGSAHGLRKALATKLANEGATVHELEALFGWRGGGMASLYTRKADRARLAGSAMDRFKSEQQTNVSAPHVEGAEGLESKKGTKTNA